MPVLYAVLLGSRRLVPTSLFQGLEVLQHPRDVLSKPLERLSVAYFLLLGLLSEVLALLFIAQLLEILLDLVDVLLDLEQGLGVPVHGDLDEDGEVDRLERYKGGEDEQHQLEGGEAGERDEEEPREGERMDDERWYRADERHDAVDAGVLRR